MARFLGKTITSAEADRITAAHQGKVNASSDGAVPTLNEVEIHYWQQADNEVVYSERAAAAQALPAVSGIGIQSK
jgi:hypothetical protein|tara:strand:- start:145 stop:369 length:225 start_codon:yes stop_codon:yes gene_type:complete